MVDLLGHTSSKSCAKPRRVRIACTSARIIGRQARLARRARRAGRDARQGIAAGGRGGGKHRGIAAVGCQRPHRGIARGCPRAHGTPLACYPPMMRTPSKYRRWIIGTEPRLALGVGLCGRRRSRLAADTQDIAQLEALAKSQAALQFPPLTDRQRFLVGPIDPRLKLERCSLPPKAAVGSGTAHARSRHGGAALPRYSGMASLCARQNRRHFDGHHRRARHRGGQRSDGQGRAHRTARCFRAAARVYGRSRRWRSG